MKKIYCISGLAADRRLFKNLVIPGYELVHMQWVGYNEDDDLVTYARKMSGLITGTMPTIIGLSMGGMIATEIGKIMPTEKIIIVSSAKTGEEVGKQPYPIDWAGRSGIVPAKLLNIPYPFVLKTLGAQTTEEKQLLSDIITDSDPDFMKWCIKAILEWRSTEWPPNVYHIHGTADKVILPKYVRPDVWVEGGSHIMILNRATEVNKLISDYLAG